MQFGVKFWSTNEELLAQCRKHYDAGDFHHMEISAIIGTYDEELLAQVKGIPCIIHCDNKLVDFSVPANNERNRLAIVEAQKFADYLGAKFIIVHPGYEATEFPGEEWGYEHVNALLAEFDDPRFCMENMPGKTFDLSGNCIGRTKEELSQLHFDNFCLDLAHAIKASITLKKDAGEIIKELLDFKPVCFHISDGVYTNEKDEHLGIGEGVFDFDFLRQFISEDSVLTLETPKSNYLSLEDDIRNIIELRKRLIIS